MVRWTLPTGLVACIRGPGLTILAAEIHSNHVDVIYLLVNPVVRPASTAWGEGNPSGMAAAYCTGLLASPRLVSTAELLLAALTTTNWAPSKLVKLPAATASAVLSPGTSTTTVLMLWLLVSSLLLPDSSAACSLVWVLTCWRG
jgi:hypothetical protein